MNQNYFKHLHCYYWKKERKKILPLRECITRISASIFHALKFWTHMVPERLKYVWIRFRFCRYSNFWQSPQCHARCVRIIKTLGVENLMTPFIGNMLNELLPGWLLGMRSGATRMRFPAWSPGTPGFNRNLFHLLPVWPIYTVYIL